MPAASTSELRRFGLTVGTAFAVLGGVSWWRGHHTPPLVLWTLAVALIVPGLVVPAALGPVQRGWMRFGHAVGEVNSRILLTVVFYVVFAPVGFVLRRIRDPLDRSLAGPRESGWMKRAPAPVDRARYERQF
jgi:saxitoxin biosynthesis operon SxtJ-like protein